MNFPDCILGLNASHLTLLQMMIRAILIFFVAILLIRISGLRTLGKLSAFDNLTTLIMGAILGRAIVVADQPFFESLITVGLIMILHRALAWLTFRSKIAGTLIKGEPIVLMKNSHWQNNNLRRTDISIDDIEEALRQDLHASSMDTVKDIYLERSGKISMIRHEEPS